MRNINLTNIQDIYDKIMKLIYVSTEANIKLPNEYSFYEGGVDEIGLEHGAIKHPLCESGSYKNVVLYTFSVENAIRFSTPLCDCTVPKIYVVLKTESEVNEFYRHLPTWKKEYCEIQK